jgi:ribosomal protein L7/L12
MPVCAHCGRETKFVTGNCDLCQQPLVDPAASDRLQEEILTLLTSGQKLEAVKRFKNSFQVSLAEAKQAIDHLEAGQLPVSSASPAGDDPDNIAELVRQGKKLVAIKDYRARHGCSLQEAKEQVEAIERQLNLPRSKSGCGVQVITWFLILGSLAAGAIAVLR